MMIIIIVGVIVFLYHMVNEDVKYSVNKEWTDKF